jgi:hypothetical protein
VVLLVFLIPVLIGAFLLAMEQLEYELLVQRQQTFTGSSRSETPSPPANSRSGRPQR